MAKRELDKEFHYQVMELRKLSRNWNLFPGAPADELDVLVHKILRQLHDGANEDKLKAVIESELVIFYGFYPDEINPSRYAKEVADWWNEKIN